MKIALYYHSPFETGGIEKTMLSRGKYLASLGNEITFIFGDRFCRADMLEEWAKYGRVIRSDLCDEVFDYVIYDSIYNNEVVQADFIIQVINNNIVNAKDVLKFNYKVDLFVTVSEECQKQLKEKYGYDSIVIPNLIDSEEIIEKSKEKYTIPKKTHNFVVVSRIDRYKGFERLGKVIEEISLITKEYQFVIVGSNDNFPDYMNSLKERWKKYNVIWVGRQSNPYKYMANADALFQLSDDESQCMVMYESMIIGTPVIVTDFDNAVKDVTEERGFVLNKDLSNLDIYSILNKKFNFKFEYKNSNKWKEILKPVEIKDKKFSIIIPNYNNAEWLDKCLSSVSNQTYKNYEVIFVDDMSTDNSVDIAYQYVEKIKHFTIIQNRSKRYNGGSRNVGILETTGDYIVCIDSDDWLIDEFVLEKLNKFIRNEDLIRTGYFLYSEKNTFKDIPKHKDIMELFKEPTVAIWTKVVKTEIMKQTLFDEGTLCEDKVFHYRLIDKIKTWRDYPEITHIWNRTNKNSTSTSKSYKWNSSCIRHIASMYDFIHETQNEQFKSYVQGRIRVVKEMIEKGDFQQI